MMILHLTPLVGATQRCVGRERNNFLLYVSDLNSSNYLALGRFLTLHVTP